MFSLSLNRCNPMSCYFFVSNLFFCSFDFLCWFSFLSCSCTSKCYWVLFHVLCLFWYHIVILWMMNHFCVWKFFFLAMLVSFGICLNFTVLQLLFPKSKINTNISNSKNNIKRTKITDHLNCTLFQKCLVGGLRPKIHQNQLNILEKLAHSIPINVSV